MASKTSTKASTPKRKRTSTAPAAPTMPTAGVLAVDGALTSESPKRTPTHEDIAFRAFELYQSRDQSEGGALHDWLTAERELRAS
ncbi:MAG TPA: DUF2934 domain-containing protein [Polyangiales bacterium]